MMVKMVEETGYVLLMAEQPEDGVSVVNLTFGVPGFRDDEAEFRMTPVFPDRDAAHAFLEEARSGELEFLKGFDSDHKVAKVTITMEMPDEQA